MIVLGILVAITGELSSFSLIAYPANFFIPITRYLGFIWMLSVAVALTKNRKIAHVAYSDDSP
jgi:predicted histidine transporter YuiF (NhaC family)